MTPTRLSRVRFFTPTAGRRHTRRVTDAILAVGTATTLAAVALVARPPSAFEQALIDLARSVPSFLNVLWELGNAALVLWAGVLVLVTLVRRRTGVLLDLALAVALAIAVMALLRWLTDADHPSDIPVALTVACSVVEAARPYLGRPFRRFGRTLIVGGLVSSVLLERATPSGAATALLIALLAASIDHLVVGTDDGRPDEATVVEALAELGIRVGSMVERGRQPAGVYVLDAVGAEADDARSFVVKIYGRDAWDTQLVMRIWRGLWYRNTDAVAATRLQQVEHEALVTLLAERHGVRAPSVVAAGPTLSKDAILVLEDPGAPLVEPDGAQLADLWQMLDAAHVAGLGLRDIAPSKLTVDPTGRVGLAELPAAISAPSAEETTIDRAQLLVTTAMLSGADAALDAAHEQLGDEQLAAIVPFLQPAALGSSLRTEMRSADGPLKVADLRTQVAERVSVSAKEVAQLRRVSTASLVQMALISIAAYTIISLISGLDADQLKSELAGGTWSWAVLGLLITQLVYGAQAVSTQGASPRDLPGGPLTALQSAIAFVQLAIPSSAARVLMVVRFFERCGVGAASAVTISGLESFSGFVVQVLLLTLLLVPGIVQLDVDVDVGGDGGGALVTVLIVLAVAMVVVVLVAILTPKLRNRILDRVRPHVADAREVLRILRNPTHVLQLLGGNLAAQVLMALGLAACVKTFGADVSLAEALAVYIAAALFGGLMPVPGGIGVVEAALMAGLVAVGVSETAGFAAAITFRIITFYLPPAWGWLSYHWLQRNDYL